VSSFTIAFLRGLQSRILGLQNHKNFKCCIHWQSFYFYIPHERPRPGGHISTQISYTSSLAPSFGKSAACISSSYHIKLSQALLQAFDELNGKVSKKRRSYGTPQKYYPSDIVSLNVIFIPLYTLWRRETLDYSFFVIHPLRGWCQTQCCNSCIVMLTLCIIS